MKTGILTLIFCLAVLPAVLIAGGYDSVVVRADNDILTYADKLSPKEAAPAEYVKALRKLMNQFKHDVKESDMPPSDFIQTFRVHTPDSNFIFAALVDRSIIGLKMFLFYYDKTSGTCSDPYEINAAFMKNNEEGFDTKMKIMEAPIVSFVDINGDGKTEMLFKRRAHNGTWNAVETIILRLDSDKISGWFKFNSREVSDGDITLLLRREIKEISGGKIVFTVNAYDIDSGRLVQAMVDEIIELPKY